MSYTKGELVHSALNEIGIADYDYDIGPEQTESALRRLDSMMADWNGRGIMLGYPAATPGSSSLDEDSLIQDAAWEAVITNLALRIAPSYGKTVSVDTRITAKNSLNNLYMRYSRPPKMQLPQMPKGAGYKSEYPFTSGPEQREVEPVDENIDLSGVPE